MDTNLLKSRWMALFLLVQNGPLENAFSALVSSYSEKHRCYHSLQHICACLILLDDVDDLVRDRFCVEVALWFHDVVYNPRRNDNESLSAQYALNFLSSIGIDDDKVSRIIHFINITKHPSNPKTNDECILVDIDLSILGEDQEIFDAYEKCIRQEYSHVPAFLYKRGRKSVLKSFLKPETIYTTKYFQEKYEDRARANITRALKQL